MILPLSQKHYIEIEYQGDTIEKFGVDFENNQFKLVAKNTACLASESCGLPSGAKIKDSLMELTQAASGCCMPGGGCC